MASILIVDDNPQLRRVLGEVLTCEGHDVTLAENGVEALALYEGEPVELVITDIYMPEMDGIEFLIRIQNAFPDARVMAISGGGFVVKRLLLDDAQVLGAVEALSKPFRHEEFLDAVERALGQPCQVHQFASA